VLLNKKILLISSIFFFTINLFSASDPTSDKKKTEENNDWVNNYINIDPTDDLYHGYKIKNHKISKKYVENLVWNQEMDFYIDELDRYNLRKNINTLPRFPFVIMGIGGFATGRGFDFGTLFRADNIANTQLALTGGNIFIQEGKLWNFLNIEYPAFLDGRLKVFGTGAFFTTYPQYASRLSSFAGSDVYWSNGELKSNYIMKLFNKVWKTLDVNFYPQAETGINFAGGFDYRIPLVELNTITSFELTYKYDHVRLENINKRSYDFGECDNEFINEIPVNQSNFGFNIREELRWNMLKQTSTIPVGAYLSYAAEFLLPTTIGEPNGQFRMKNRIEVKYTKKLFREVAGRARLIMAANYNLSEDFSGDPYIRGLANQELTGWFATFLNLELFIPIINIDMKQAASIDFTRDAKFLLYLVLFSDLGFSIENYSFLLDNAYERYPKESIKNALFPFNNDKQYHIKDGHYFLPAATAGGGIRIYPYFLNFIIRFDVGVNILKAAIEKSGECVELVFSLSEMF